MLRSVLIARMFLLSRCISDEWLVAAPDNVLETEEVAGEDDPTAMLDYF